MTVHIWMMRKLLRKLPPRPPSNSYYKLYQNMLCWCEFPAIVSASPNNENTTKLIRTEHEQETALPGIIWFGLHFLSTRKKGTCWFAKFRLLTLFLHTYFTIPVCRWVSCSWMKNIDFSLLCECWGRSLMFGLFIILPVYQSSSWNFD